MSQEQCCAITVSGALPADMALSLHAAQVQKSCGKGQTSLEDCHHFTHTGFRLSLCIIMNEQNYSSW